MAIFSVLLFGRPAVAGWQPGVDGTVPDFGGDYAGAATYALNAIYGYPTPDRGITLNSTTVASACHSYIGTAELCGEAILRCASGTVPTINGCLTTISGYPGRQRNCHCRVGDPVDAMTGNVFERVDDFATSSPTLSASRFYSSDTSYVASNVLTPSSRFGYGWRSEYDRSLSIGSGVDATTPDGMPLHFVSSGGAWVLGYYDVPTNSWLTPRLDVDYRLTTDGTYWYLADSNDTIDKYSNSGQLLTISYRGGYTQTLTYNGSNQNTAVADSLGRQIMFAYTNGLASSVTDPDGNVTQYFYTDQSPYPAPPGSSSLWVLQSVVYPANSGTPTLTYLYEDTRSINRFALTGVVDENGNRYATWAYDAQGRATSNTLAGGANQTTIAYNDTTNTRTVTNALGKPVLYSTGGFAGTLQLSAMAGSATAHTAAATQSFAYDTNGFVSQLTDWNGNITTYVHNSIGQETSRTEGVGTSVARTITTTWDATWREPDEIVEPNLTTDFTYDASGRLTQLKLTDTTTQTVPYPTNGQTRIWTYAYNAANLLYTVDGPLSGSGDTTTYTYDAHGFVASVTDQVGHVTTITSNNGRGEPLSSVDPNSVTTNYSYDPRGRILGFTVNPGAGQATTTFTYDAAGNIIGIQAPDGSTLTYAYDNAHRLTSVANNFGETITYTLDALGGRTATVVKSASVSITKQQTATFDELGRLLTEIGAASQTTTHAYDPNSNETSTTDPRSKVYGHAFDALNRLYQQTDPDSFQTVVAYNGNDDPTSVTDARSNATSYVRDGFGDVIRQTSPDTGVTDFWYDANGNVIKTIDARSIETDFTFDTASRVLTKTFPAASAENITYTYDATSGGNLGVGRLTGIADQSGSTAFTYNALGQVTLDHRVVGSNGYDVTYSYDPAGNILSETYPSGRIVTYTRDAVGRVSAASTYQSSGAPPVPVASSITYDPFGPLASLTFGNALVASLAYDQDYQLTGITTGLGTVAVQNLTNGFDPAGNITAITDAIASGRTQALTYDDLNRLATASGVYGAQSYTYDGVGNRLTRVVGATTDTYAYPSTSNQIATITTGSNVRSFSYLASGQVSGDVRDSSHSYTFVANNNGRNASASLNGSTVGSYVYNALEQRVGKTASGSTIQFVYDSAGHLIEEADASTGAPMREYIWIDDLPLSLVDDTGSAPVIFYIHTDQVGSPQKITDGSGALVWDGVFDPFGNQTAATTPTTSPTNWGVGIWGSFNWAGIPLSTNPLRFPGQYADVETQIAQNWARDYDSTVGRYFQSDPLGIQIDVNTYAYVQSNPVIWIDPSGLCWIYFISTGRIEHQADNGNIDFSGNGYSGRGVGLNNPAMQSLIGTEDGLPAGPIPVGRWIIGPPHYSPRTGPGTMNLTPAPGTNALGRNLFRIHGDNLRANHTASEGCIIADKRIRGRISDSGDTCLLVRP
ncbi:RHS repeat-associated core domain-containing protein [Phenylobacterium sp.]|uniref:RHS repeat-associated core domain-containing protein n=1 Tax=Phenylobacterium sp. TaxID=1871053 RepID=UPI0025DA0C34|nr:RHS repeat-associated core domain-containing protein [Phenylobacterium sp.]